jgi:indole-3-glycerol phosphate synthase
MNLLDQIFQAKREASTATTARLAELRVAAADAPPPRGFARALRGSPHAVALIAEAKRATPSVGVLREPFDAAELAMAYESAGADALSVLTDERFFQGNALDLTRSRNATALPVLRKDFTVCEADVYEARAIGADAVLLIVNGLHASQLREFRECAESLGMDALVEAHSVGEAEAAIASGASLIGVNNRNLEDFRTDVSVGESVLPRLAGRATLVSESALRSAEDVRRVAAAGARAVLIGTAIVKAPDPGAKVR